jgi:hypothetical protein
VLLTDELEQAILQEGLPLEDIAAKLQEYLLAGVGWCCIERWRVRWVEQQFCSGGTHISEYMGACRF